jgi:hypothetical protein
LADRLPNPTLESQVFTLDTRIEATGIITDTADLSSSLRQMRLTPEYSGTVKCWPKWFLLIPSEHLVKE